VNQSSTQSTQSPIVYIGTCEQHPVNDAEVAYDPVYNDIGGPRTPFDKEYQGETEVILLDLNRFNWFNLNLMLSPPLYQGMVGWTNRLARGSLLLQQGLSYELWLQYSFFRTANATPDLPPGTYYPACNTLTNQTPKQGTKTKTKRVVVESNNWYTKSDGSFFLKSHDLSYFSVLPAPPPG
jgi:hypothetical protein